MEEVLLQGRAALRLLALLGALLLWPLLSPSGDPLESARKIVDGVLFPVTLDNNLLADDPLAGKSIDVQRPLAQYRFEFKPYDLQHAVGASLSSLELRRILSEKRTALEPVSVAAILELGDEAFLQESERTSSPLSEIYLRHYRVELGQLESWYAGSGLGRYATLGDLQTAVESRVAVPMLEQLVNLKVLIGCSTIVLFLLHGYLFSLLSTVKQLAAPEDWRALRSWLPFHQNTVGQMLTWLNLGGPTVLWLLHTMGQPLLRTGNLPNLLSFGIAATLCASTAGIFWEFKRLAQHLDSLKATEANAKALSEKEVNQNQSGSVVPFESRAVAMAPRLRNRAA